MDANKIKAKIVVNGNCIICKKELSGNKIFFCEECEEKVRANAIEETAKKVFGKESL